MKLATALPPLKFQKDGKGMAGHDCQRGRGSSTVDRIPVSPAARHTAK